MKEETISVSYTRTHSIGGKTITETVSCVVPRSVHPLEDQIRYAVRSLQSTIMIEMELKDASDGDYVHDFMSPQSHCPNCGRLLGRGEHHDCWK